MGFNVQGELGSLCKLALGRFGDVRLAFVDSAGLGRLGWMSERLRYPELAPEGVAPMRGLEHYLNAITALPAVLLELVRLRASVLNGCAFCIGHHTQELRKHNEPETRIAAVREWSGSDAFTPKECAALAWTDSITNIQQDHASDAEYGNVSAFFEGKDLVDLTLAIASINAWNRMSIAFGAEWKPKQGERGTEGAEAPPEENPATTAPATGGGSPATGQPGSADVVGQTNQSSDARAPEPAGTAESPHGTTTAHEDAPTEDVVDDDGGKVAQD